MNYDLSTRDSGIGSWTIGGDRAMVRQARSEATRQKIIAAAVDLFTEIGYPAVGLGDIFERAELTKGALYYHFDSKQSLANAIIEEAASRFVKAFTGIFESGGPALESVIHGVFVAADLLSSDLLVRSGTQLLRGFGEFNELADTVYTSWIEEIAMRVREAMDEGDLRVDTDPQWVSETVVAAMVGSELLSNATAAGADLLSRVAHAWQLILPAIATEEALPYLTEFLARESLRYPISGG